MLRYRAILHVMFQFLELGLEHTLVLIRTSLASDEKRSVQEHCDPLLQINRCGIDRCAYRCKARNLKQSKDPLLGT